VEAQQARSLGHEVVVAEADAWLRMDSAQFSGFSAIVFGDPSCIADPSPLDPAVMNRGVWAPVVTGPVIAIVTDPALHRTAGALALIRNGIGYAASAAGRTGLYVTLACSYHDAPERTPVEVLGPFGAFTVRSQTSCPNAMHIVETEHPAMAGLSDALLSNWGCSAHGGFDGWPSDFQVLAIASEIPSSYVARDGRRGAPYILARGGGDPPPAFYSEYDEAPLPDDLTPELSVRLHARVYWPSPLSTGRPIIFIAHGNHDISGAYAGFEYLARPLTASGYIVVSVDVGGLPDSDGATHTGRYKDDPSIILARGRVFLRHVQLWAQWSDPASGISPPASLGLGPNGLHDAVDMQEVGFLGHSRGGEAVRAAYAYLDPTRRGLGAALIPYSWPSSVPKPRVRGIFEIAPDEGSTPYDLDAHGTAWNVLLGVCDGDIWRMEGIRVFDRALAKRNADDPQSPKSAMLLWGANHNFFNELLSGDAAAQCGGVGNTPLSPAAQRTVALGTIPPFFEAWVGAQADPVRARIFDPQFPGPAVGRVTLERSYSASPHQAVSTAVDDFPFIADIHADLHPDEAGGHTIHPEWVRLTEVETNPEHDEVQTAIRIEWNAHNNNGRNARLPYYQVNGPLVTRPDHALLEFRVTRPEGRRPYDNPPGVSTTFTVQLVYSGDLLSQAVRVGDGTPVALRGPVSGAYGDMHPLLATVRIPLDDFGTPRGTYIKGVRLTFGWSDSGGTDSPSGTIYLANVRLSRR
jgi:hypothetical protein